MCIEVEVDGEKTVGGYRLRPVITIKAMEIR